MKPRRRHVGRDRRPQRGASTRRGTPARRSSRPARASGTPQPVVIAVIGGVGLLVVIGLFMMTGKKKGPATAPVVHQPKPAKVDPQEAQVTAAIAWYEDNFFNDYGKSARLSGERIEALIAEGEKRNYGALRAFGWKAKKDRVYKLLLRSDPLHPAANRHFGNVPLSTYPDFFKVLYRMGNHVALPEDFAKFRDEMEAKVQTKPVRRAPVMTLVEYRKAEQLLHRFVAWDKRLQDDPRALAILNARKRVSTDPLLGRYEPIHIEVPPFVVFYAAPKSKGGTSARDIKRYREKLESFRSLIVSYVEFFRSRWIQPLKLKEFDKDQLFFVWIFGDRDSWLEYGRNAGIPPPPGMVGYFSPLDQWVFLYEDSKERLTVESSLAHELTHQLHHHFSSDTGKFVNHFKRIKAVWFSEGWAEYAGWTKKVGSEYRFGQTSAERVRSLRTLKKYGLPLFPVRDLVKRENYREWLSFAIMEWLPKQRLKADVDPQVLASVFLEILYAQSWLLVSFMYEFEQGKYSKNAMAFTKAALRGFKDHRGVRGYAQAHEVFAKMFELKTDAAWAKFQKEYEQYMRDKFYEVR